MHRSGLLTLLTSAAFLTRYCQNQSTESATLSSLITETVTTERAKQENRSVYMDMEIIGIEVLPKLGNVVVLSWGKALKEYDLDWTYGVYYGLSMEEALREPKLTTKELYAEVANLSFCSQYLFAVGVVNADEKIAHPARNIRTIGTLIDEQSPPENLRVDFIPDEEPCLLITWSASCPNIAAPLGYTLTVQEADSPRMTIVRHPRSTAVDLRQSLRAIYGKSYDVKVAADVVGSRATAMLSYTVPHFLQPYKVRLTSRPDGTFVMYWHEPYVPYYVGDFFYEVYVYPGRGLVSQPMIYATDRSAFLFRGNQSEYTFMVGLRAAQGELKSHLTEPVVQNLLGQNFTLHIS